MRSAGSTGLSTPSHPSAGPQQVLAYLGRYTHRVAIANNRLLALDEGSVRFAWKDYRHGGNTKVMALEADEFIRRFLLHTLPDGFHRIRHYGFLANGDRTERLDQCRRAARHGSSPLSERRARTTPTIASSPGVTSPSAPRAAAPCGASPSCRARPYRRFAVTPHEPDPTPFVVQSASSRGHRLAAMASAVALACSKPFLNCNARKRLPFEAAATRSRPQQPTRRKQRLGRCLGLGRSTAAMTHDTFAIALNRPAASLNPASMRSRPRPPSASVPRDLTEASRFPR